MLAYHWSSALELVRASGGDDDEIVDRTRRASLRAAGDRAFALNSLRRRRCAVRGCARPLAGRRRAARSALPASRRAPLRLRRGAAGTRRSKPRATHCWRSAIPIAPPRPSRSSRGLLGSRGARTRAEHLARAEELAGDSDSLAAARVLAFAGGSARSRARRRRTTARRGRLAIADGLELDELRAHALTTIGMAKNDADDRSGIADIERALEIALAADSPGRGVDRQQPRRVRDVRGDFPRTDELYAEALRLSERYGDRSSVRFIRGNRIWIDYMLGRWDRALESADAFIAECEAGSPTRWSCSSRGRRALILARGNRERALRDQLRRDRARIREVTTRCSDSAHSRALCDLRRGRAARRGACARGAACPRWCGRSVCTAR